ncbi:hypothetical protein T01_7648 [Trichinella spiralis]|uniref:Uncharacterized protein n=1 Tax=Trichinella spiralis TaxID=6334 RepID=A0A0V1BTJ3_TRISP|nr:hypothetical protein T01_7648 [Trichinella spiralis]
MHNNYNKSDIGDSTQKNSSEVPGYLNFQYTDFISYVKQTVELLNKLHCPCRATKNCLIELKIAPLHGNL